MGYMRNHAIVVTAMDIRGDVERAHAEAVIRFGDAVTPILPKATNGYQSFLIGPDGSKEGWRESDEGDARRAAFKAWLREERAADRVYADWVEVQYGDDERETKIVDHSDASEVDKS